jgi:hypothetical protein
MRKQYVVKEGPTFRVWISTYHDGVPMQEDKIWLDDYDDFITKLESEGYERAYTKKEIQEAKEEYERLSARQLMEVVR